MSEPVLLRGPRSTRAPGVNSLEVVDQLVESLGMDVQVQHRRPELTQDGASGLLGPARRTPALQQSSKPRALFIELDELALDDGAVMRVGVPRNGCHHLPPNRFLARNSDP